jgi:hypothetical protein
LHGIVCASSPRPFLAHKSSAERGYAYRCGWLCHPEGPGTAGATSLLAWTRSPSGGSLIPGVAREAADVSDVTGAACARDRGDSGLAVRSSLVYASRRKGRTGAITLRRAELAHACQPPRRHRLPAGLLPIMRGPGIPGRSGGHPPIVIPLDRKGRTGRRAGSDEPARRTTEGRRM